MATLTLLGTVQNVDPRLLDAAQALGAPGWKAHLGITLPLCMRGLLAAFLFAFTFSISAFVIPMILGKGRVLFISNLIYNRFSEIADYPSGAAVSMVLFFVALAIVYGTSRQINKTVGPMSGRLIDDLMRLAGLVLIGTIVLFLLTPIVVTTIMAFDARSYLGPLPPPALSLRWFAQFFADDTFLRGLAVSVELAVLSVAIAVSVGVLTAYALERTRFAGKDALISLFLSPLLGVGRELQS